MKTIKFVAGSPLKREVGVVVRCSKCGYVTFSVHAGCPKCGKSAPSAVRTITSPRRRKSGRGAAYLSPLSMGEIPRFYSTQENSEVISLLGDASPASTFSSPAAAVFGDEPIPLAVEESDSADSGLGDDSWLEDDAAGSSEEVLDIGEDNEEISLDEVIDDAAALADKPETALEADAEIAPTEPLAVNEPELEDFDSLLDEAAGDAGAETPDAELEGFDELAGEEISPAQGPEDVAAGGAQAEEAAAGGDDVDDILSEASGGEDELESGLEEPVAAESGGDSESVDDMWAEAFAEQEAVGAAPAEEAAAGGDDISNMWDDAFAEQDAAGKADVEELGDASSEMPDVQDGPESVPDEGEIAELDDSDLEKLWDEALEGSGDDDAVLGEISVEQEDEGELEDVADIEEESEFHELPVDGGDIVGQDELDALLSGAGDNIETDEGAEGGDDDEIGDEDFEPSGAADPFGDDGEIEAFIEDGGGEAGEEAEEHLEEIYAPLQNRLIAGLVDTVLVGFLVILFAVGTHFIIGQVVDSVYGNPESLAMVVAIDLVILFLLSFFYAVYFIGGWGGTPGLRTAGLVVVDLENRPVGYMQAVLRYFGTLAAVLPAGLGQILTVIDKRGRGLGDRLAGTKVIFRASL